MSIQPRVLVVDDEAANRKLLVDLVRREDCEAIAANGGAQALSILASEPIDLVLLDIMMPEVDGMAVLARLKAQGALPTLPVVIVTAHEDRKVRIDALAAGAIDFLTKPIDRLEVACKVRTLIELGRLRASAIRPVENALRESEHRLRLRFEQSPVAEIEWDIHFRVTAWNPAAARLFGYSRAEALGQHAGFIIPEHDRAEGTAVCRELVTGTATESTRHNVAKGGRALVCEWHNAPLHTADATPLGISSVVLDVSARESLQEALVQSRKMDALGQLAGGIAHDFNNILSVILSYSTFIRDALPAADSRRDDIVEVLKAADLAVDLTKQLLTFSRRQPTTKKPTDLNQSLCEISKLLARSVGEDIELNVVPSARAAIVLIDPAQFDQIVLNLAVNARDAMPNGGRLRIGLEHPPKTEPASDDLGTVRLTVSDTGIGMDEATQRHIFEPFFTTKEKGKGTGLGLATCFGIVEDAGGTVGVHSIPGQGTTFTVELPLSGESVAAGRSARAVPRAGRGEAVLVVEDEPALRNVALRVLESAGYQVHVATDGHDALRRIDELRSRLDLIITDVVMPGCSGYDVVAHAASVSPSTAVIVTSGYLNESVRRNQREDLAILWKPWLPHELVRAVAEALSARKAANGTLTLPAGPRSSVPAIPLAKLPRQSSPRATAAPVPPQARIERLLVVEDDRAFATASQRILEGSGFEVVVVGTLEAARGALAAGGFDALLLDAGLPDGSGFDLLKELRGENAELPVVMVTIDPSVESASLAIRSRVREYLPKPFPAHELLRVVREAVDAGRIARVRTKLLTARFGGDQFVADLAETEKTFTLALPKIHMAYQPIVRSADGSIFGYEALLRCDEPAFASPLRLLAAAEILGRVADVGRIVRASVAMTLLEHAGGLDAIFVNIHPSELRAELLAELSDPLVPMAHRIVLEVTERAHIEPGPAIDAELTQIRKLGYRIAVDDLGEGYAGLSSLVTMRPDIVKIDMSLVRDVQRAPLKRDIIAALVDMARRSGIAVVAEGVETEGECHTLIDLGCDLLQGYLFGKPSPPFIPSRRDWEHKP